MCEADFHQEKHKLQKSPSALRRTDGDFGRNQIGTAVSHTAENSRSASRKSPF